MIVIAHQAIGIAEPAKTVDDLCEKGAPQRPIAVVITMSCRSVSRLVTWYTAPWNSIRKHEPWGGMRSRNHVSLQDVTSFSSVLAKGNKR
jgi:hypothetical protein